MTSDMLASHAQWPREEDPIFEKAGRAKEAIRLKGREEIIDSTLGALYQDDGKLVTLKTVYDDLKNMKNEDIASYAPIAGSKDFQENVIDLCFGDYRPDTYIRALQTPGGTGAVRNCLRTFAGPGDVVICPDRYRKPYQTICQEFGSDFRTFKLFTEDYTFNLEAFEKAFRGTLKERDRIVVILNTPANNPTGYSLSDEERDGLLKIVLDEAKNGEKKIALLVDVAYMEFAGDGEQKAFFKKFSRLPSNVFVQIAYSMSKAFTAYGMRSGAAIGLSSDRETIEDFYFSLSHTNRCNRSNGNHAAMNIAVDLNTNPEKKAAYRKELAFYKDLLQKRAEAFIGEARKVDLLMVPYFGGFFISLPCQRPQEVADILEEAGLYLISNPNGLRFAICAVSEEKCRLAPRLIKEAIDRVNLK